MRERLPPPYDSADRGADRQPTGCRLGPGRRPRGIRANAVALGSIDNERYRAFLAGQAPAEAERTAERMAHFRHSTDPTDGMNWCSVHRPSKNRTETGLYGT